MLSRLHRRPWVGLLGLSVGFLTQPLGHAVFMLNANTFGERAVYTSAFMGLFGLTLVYQGLRQPEVKATWMGMLGGWFLWMGWFEYAFNFFAGLYAVPPFAVEPTIEGGYVAMPAANMLQATVTLMLALFIVYGLFNRETKCNLIRWLHRNLGMDPGRPTPGLGRSFARITAMEMLFVTWFCYLFWLYVIYLGTRGTGAQIVMGIYLAWLAWSVYLIYRCTLQPRVGLALRYGIAAGIVLWGSAEMPAHFGAYREYWLLPADYPIFNACLALLFIGGLALIAREANRG